MAFIKDSGAICSQLRRKELSPSSGAPPPPALEGALLELWVWWKWGLREEEKEEEGLLKPVNPLSSRVNGRATGHQSLVEHSQCGVRGHVPRSKVLCAPALP